MSVTLFRDQNAPRIKKDIDDVIVAGAPEQHGQLMYAGHRETIKSGIWECTDGSFTADYDGIVEFCHVLEGGATITTDKGDVCDVSAGDSFVLEAGLRTRWDVDTYIKKHFVICAVP